MKSKKKKKKKKKQKKRKPINIALQFLIQLEKKVISVE